MHTYYRIKKIKFTHIQQEHDKGRRETKVMQGMQIKCWQMGKNKNEHYKWCKQFKHGNGQWFTFGWVYVTFLAAALVTTSFVTNLIVCL